ncbi:radical SAM family heme chaperone HemW [Pontivivens ytuae]|uniref:Heme chaperone HemW n=1 Tax=Pontivivens ytuae TaxID=2789856 RepID=A0A7S9QF49_9RHOB|nr:radical SAM family heme chaperone HemW [Pontivivens ytuae]QPH55881.1 coproporphyrinogen III oxidase [Pontivivens ytuae]
MTEAGFGIYVHWPFCAAKCPYCDFNSHVRREVDHAAWRAALRQELRWYAERVPGRPVDTVFFGGGTPSLMAPETVHDLLQEIDAIWGLRPRAEVTLEANPTSVEAGRFRDFRQAGINRVSMGIQALRDDDLKRLGRLHSVAEARAAFDIARGAFERVSFDLIYARQGQTLEEWQRELREALSMAVDHLSLYQLTIEPGTAFGDLHRAGRLRDLPDDGLSADMYMATQEMTEAAGMGAYEISNHARAGAVSAHNMIYWRCGDYVGVGPGAHGRVELEGTRSATETVRQPEAYLAAVAEQSNAVKSVEVVSREEQAVEHLLMGLRLTEGVSLARHKKIAGHALDLSGVAALIEQGLVDVSGDRLRIPAVGRPVTNAILRELLSY